VSGKKEGVWVKVSMPKQIYTTTNNEACSKPVMVLQREIVTSKSGNTKTSEMSGQTFN
jgi:hypothetical protein